MRVRHLVIALIQREQPAEREQHETHHKRPEVPRAAVAEGMQIGGAVAGAARAEHKQALVARVGDRVDRFRQQRGRAGKQEPGEFGQPDSDVGEERTQSRTAAAVMSAAIDCAVTAHRSRLPLWPVVLSGASALAGRRPLWHRSHSARHRPRRGSTTGLTTKYATASAKRSVYRVKPATRTRVTNPETRARPCALGCPV